MPTSSPAACACPPDSRQGATRADGDLTRQDVHRTQIGQAAHAEHDLATPRNGSAHEPRIAALRDHRHAELGADRERRRDLLCVGRPHHGAGTAAEPPRPVDLVRGAHVRLGQDMLRSEDADECTHQGVYGHTPILAEVLSGPA